MEKYFVTYFDSNYLSRGLTLYESLIKVCDDLKIIMIAFDDLCYKKLSELDLKHAIVVPLETIEDCELLSVKGTRSRGEYCWTATPKAIQYVLDNYKCDICIYVDADLFFFSDPNILLAEMGAQESVMITAHRYCNSNDYTEMAGKYNVQFMPFKNDDKSREVLAWWNERCIDNCSIDIDAGIYGDQKYLDDWCERFQGVTELNNIGGGVAPWNVDRYSIKQTSDGLFVYEKETDIKEKLVFYHFHNIKFFDKGVVNIGDDGYYFPDTAITYIYKKYLNDHEQTRKKYNLDDTWINQQHFRDDDVDHLVHAKYYFLLDMFL